MNILLFTLSSQYTHASLAPWCLRAGLRRYSAQPHTVTVIEGTINQTQEDILALFDGRQADLLAVSCAIWNWTATAALLPRLRQRYPKAYLVLGGPEPSMRPRQALLECPQADGLLQGEGEVSIAQLADALSESPHRPSLERVGNLWWRREGQIVSNPALPLLSDPPSPWDETSLAALRGRIAYLETSRGCPFSCGFCLSGRDDPPRFFPLEQAQAQLLALARAGAKTIKLVDRTFNCHPQRARALVQFILDHYPQHIPPGCCFHLEVAADLFDDETVALLRRAPAGLFQLEVGLQSLHGPTHEAVMRRTDLALAARRFGQLRQRGNIHLHLDLIAGLPHEDYRQFQHSFAGAWALRPHQLQLGFLKLLPGSRLHRDRDRWGYEFDLQPPYEIQSAPWLSAGELAELKAAEDALERLHNSGRFALTLAYLLKATGLEPFDLFLSFGRWCRDKGVAGIALNDYIQYILLYFSPHPGVDSDLLRDTLVCDRLCCNREGRLPRCLQRPDRHLAGLRRALGPRQAVAILYWGRPRAVVADYHQADPVTGRYPLSFVPLKEST